MILKKKTLRLILIYFIAAALTLGGFIYTEYARAQSYKRQLTLTYSHAFAELSVCMDKISTSLQKTVYASSPSMLSSLCADVYSQAASAAMVIGSLPSSNIELEHTASFMAKTGDYAYYLLKNAAAGNVRTDEESVNITQLSQNAKSLSEQISALQAALLSGEMDINSVTGAEHELGEHDNSGNASGNSYGFQKLEEEFPEMPTLIYDGPFSASVENMDAKLLENAKKISEEEALDIAAQYANISVENLSVDYTSENNIPIYVISGTSEKDTLSFEITVNGGYVMTYNNTRTASDSLLSEEDAVKKAADFLEEAGYESMTTTYWEKVQNEIIVNFAYSQNDVVCYPDLVKVTVALDTGDVTGFDSLNYISNHHERTIVDPAISKDDASSSLSSSLEVLSISETVIPTSGKNEVHCFEFKCRDTEQGLCLIYVNAETGIEEKILIVIENENGTLTI